MLRFEIDPVVPSLWLLGVRTACDNRLSLFEGFLFGAREFVDYSDSSAIGMYQFDEFAADSLPPDPPTRTEAVMLVQEAAAKDPRFLKFLNEWFPVDHGLRTSDSGMPQEASTISGHQGLDEGLVPTESFKNSQTVATQLSSPMQGNRTAEGTLNKD